MAEIHYLGATQNQTRKAGELRITSPIEQLTAGELDLLLTRQRLEIEKMNSGNIGGPFNFQTSHYNAALAVVNKCIANIKNPDVICGLGDSIAAKAAANGKKTAAGKLLQKTGNAIKTGVKALSKVATAPARILAKGAMEIYLPKAAPFFLYLFAAENALPDVMKAKRKKADKFKKFIVSGLGMQEKHFTALIRNSLTKQFGKSPESFLAQKLRSAAVGGIGKKPAKITLRNRNGGKLPKLKLETVKAPTGQLMQRIAPNVDLTIKNIVNPVKPVKTKPTFDGNIIQFAVNALVWLIGKIGGNGNPGTITAKDFPDVENDAANVFEYKDMQEDYSNLGPSQKDLLKDTAADLLQKNAQDSTIVQVLKTVLPALTQKQVNEVKYEIKEGAESLDQHEANDLARHVKMNVVDSSAEGDLNAFENSGGGTGSGICSC
jgi:hypothetical protein